MNAPIMDKQSDFVAIDLSTPTGETGHGRLPVQILADGVRTRRALKAAGTAFGVGLILIFMPLMHLVGPLVSWTVAVTLLVRRLGERERLQDCAVTCPKCGGTAPIAEQRLQWPLMTICRGCRWQITIQPSAPGTLGGHETGTPAAPV